MKFSELYGDMSGTTFEGDMDMSNKGLTSLEGMPDVVNGMLICSENKLITLDGMPHTIYGNCFINHNKLTSLKGIAQAVYGDIYCSGNQLTSLKGIPKKLYGIIDCFNNKNEHLQQEFFFIFQNPHLTEDIIKIKMYLQTKSEYYLTPEEYEEYIEKYPQHFV